MTAEWMVRNKKKETVSYILMKNYVNRHLFFFGTCLKKVLTIMFHLLTLVQLHELTMKNTSKEFINLS